MITYLLQSSFCSLLFYLVYILFFKIHTLHAFNRIYLLLSISFSIFIPWIKITTSMETVISQTSLNNSIHSAPTSELPIITLSNVLSTTYFTGVIFSMLYFLFRLIRLLQIIQKGDKSYINNNKIVTVNEEIATCSFLNNIIIPNTKQEKLSLFEITHEKVHISQYHSLDIIIAWIFSPSFGSIPLPICTKID